MKQWFKGHISQIIISLITSILGGTLVAWGLDTWQNRKIVKPPYVNFYEQNKKTEEPSWKKLSPADQKDIFKNFIKELYEDESKLPNEE